MQRPSSFPPLPAPPPSVTETNIKHWRRSLEDYVGFKNGNVVNPPPAGGYDPEGWAYLANAYVSDYLSRWNEANDLAQGRKLRQWADTAVQKALQLDSTSSTAIYAQGLLNRANGDYASALTQFQKLVQPGAPNVSRYHAQYAMNSLTSGTRTIRPINHLTMLWWPQKLQLGWL